MCLSNWAGEQAIGTAEEICSSPPSEKCNDMMAKCFYQFPRLQEPTAPFIRRRMDQEDNQKSISKLPLASAAAGAPDQMSEH